MQPLFQQRFRKEIRNGEISFDFALSGEQALSYLVERHSEVVLILSDINMPGMSGLDFQDEMLRGGISLPVIFITAHGDIPMSVRAMKAGALEFLTKPFREQDLLDAIARGLNHDRQRREVSQALADLQRRYASLSEGERSVMDLVVTGLLNKQVAARLGVSEVTVKVRRGALMKKMQADSLADLVRLSERLKLGDSPGR